MNITKSLGLIVHHLGKEMDTYKGFSVLGEKGGSLGFILHGRSTITVACT